MNKKLHPVVVVLIFAGLVLALGLIFGNLFAAAICVGMFLVLGLFISRLNRLEAWDARRRGREVGLSPRTVVMVFSTVAIVMTVICGFAGGWILAVSVPFGILVFFIVTILFRMVLGLPLLLIDENDTRHRMRADSHCAGLPRGKSVFPTCDIRGDGDRELTMGKQNTDE